MSDTEMGAARVMVNELGYTPQQVWDILLYQARITAVAEIAILVIMFTVAIASTVFVYRRTTSSINAHEEMVFATWEGESAWWAWAFLLTYMFWFMYIVISLTDGIISALANPEYWALTTLSRYM